MIRWKDDICIVYDIVYVDMYGIVYAYLVCKRNNNLAFFLFHYLFSSIIVFLQYIYIFTALWPIWRSNYDYNVSPHIHLSPCREIILILIGFQIFMRKSTILHPRLECKALKKLWRGIWEIVLLICISMCWMCAPYYIKISDYSAKLYEITTHFWYSVGPPCETLA